MKKILLSVHAQYCELIFRGKKTIEVRRTRPKLEPPFEVLVYETKGQFIKSVKGACTTYGYGRGKVIGSFICDKITRYESEFWDDDTYERIQEPWEPSDFAEYGEYEYDTIGENGEFYGKGIELSKQSCLSWNELRSYVGQGIRNFYGWHISDLKIYDKPKKLRAFISIKCMNKNGTCSDCKVKPVCVNYLTRAPQSWQYVEEN